MQLHRRASYFAGASFLFCLGSAIPVNAQDNSPKLVVITCGDVLSQDISATVKRSLDQVSQIIKLNTPGRHLFYEMPSNYSRRSLYDAVATARARIGNNDALLFLYCGHGLADQRRGTYIKMPFSEEPVFLSDIQHWVSGQIQGLRVPRLGIVMADCCSLPEAPPVAPAMVMPKPGEVSPLFQSLFFEATGEVVINSSRYGEAAFTVGGNGNADPVMVGPPTLFAWALSDSFGNNKRRLEWPQLVREVRQSINKNFVELFPNGILGPADAQHIQLRQTVIGVINNQYVDGIGFYPQGGK